MSRFEASFIVHEGSVAGQPFSKERLARFVWPNFDRRRRELPIKPDNVI